MRGRESRAVEQRELSRAARATAIAVAALAIAIGTARAVRTAVDELR